MKAIVCDKCGQVMLLEDYIPQLLSRVYHELICEEMWNILKEFRNPKIDFKALNNLSIAKVKTVKPDIFG